MPDSTSELLLALERIAKKSIKDTVDKSKVKESETPLSPSCSEHLETARDELIRSTDANHAHQYHLHSDIRR
jgi:hypothetical protein